MFKYCEKLDTVISQKLCERLIEEKLPDIIDALVNGFPPEKVCDIIIGDCSTASTTTAEPGGMLLCQYQY